MALLEEYHVSGALERACEDLWSAIDETKRPSFEKFAKKERDYLHELFSIDRENIEVSVTKSVCGNARAILGSILESLAYAPVSDIAELLADRLRYATKEDKRIASNILHDSFR